MLVGETPNPGKERENMSENRTRPLQKKFRVTAEEWAIIQQKMKLAGMTDYGEFLRQMAMKGYVIEIDFSEIKKLTNEVGGISRNINQIVRRVNTTDTLYREDLRDIQEYMEKVWKLLRNTLSRYNRYTK